MTSSRKANRSNKSFSSYPSIPGRMVVIDLIINPFIKGLTKKSHFPYYLLIVDAFSHLPVLLGTHSVSSNQMLNLIRTYKTLYQPTIDSTTTPDVNFFDVMQHDDFGRIHADAGAQFKSAEFIQVCKDAGIHATAAAPHHQEQNGLCERTWQSLRTLAFAFMNHARVSEDFGGMALEHAWKVLAVLPSRNLHKDGRSTTPYELFYGRKPSLQTFRVLFCPCVYKVHTREHSTYSYNENNKRIKHVRRYNSSNHPQRGVIGIFVGFPRNQAGYLVWDPRGKALRVSLDVTFDEQFTSHGPRRHFTFKDSHPVSTPDDIPVLEHFLDTVPPDNFK
jgi:hypothetical protein